MCAPASPVELTATCPAAVDKLEYAELQGYQVVQFGDVAANHKRPRPEVYARILGGLSVLRQFDWIWLVSGGRLKLAHPARACLLVNTRKRMPCILPVGSAVQMT